MRAVPAAADPITGEALAELVCQYNLANAIMIRLARVIDRAALRGLAGVVAFGVARIRWPPTAIVAGVKLDVSAQ
jgi:hypothetical protein